MKKVYIQPKTEVVTTKLNVCMLGGSNPTGSKVFNDTPANSSKGVLTKDRGENNFDDEPAYGDLW